MMIGPYLRKEFEQFLHDPVGIVVAVAAPFVVVWLFSLLDLAPIDYGGQFRETSPVALILCLSVWLSSLTAAATALYRERVGGTLQRLAATPFSPGLLVVTKAFVLALVGLAQAVVVWVSARTLLGADLGRAGDAGGILALFLLGFETVALGVLLATLLRSPTQIANIVTLLTLGVITLSGFFKPVAELGALAPIAKYLPFTLAYEAVRAVVAGAALPVDAYATMALEGILFLTLGAWILRLNRRSTASD